MVPVPPALYRAIVVPTAAFSGRPATVNGGAAVKVNEAVPVSVPLVTITAHVPAAVAVSAKPVLLLPVTTHPVLVVE